MKTAPETPERAASLYLMVQQHFSPQFLPLLLILMHLSLSFVMTMTMTMNSLQRAMLSSPSPRRNPKLRTDSKASKRESKDLLKSQQESKDFFKSQQEREQGLLQKPARERARSYSKSSKREREGLIQNPAREREKQAECKLALRVVCVLLLYSSYTIA